MPPLRSLLPVVLVTASTALAQTPRTACDWLEIAAPDVALGGPVTLSLTEDRSIGNAAVTVCTATTAAGDSLALLRRVMPTDGKDIAAIVAAHHDELAAAMLPPPEFESLDLGDAALWEASVHQLTVWSHGGEVMMIFTLFGPNSRARASALASAVLAAGG